jgi:hypothetical protein
VALQLIVLAVFPERDVLALVRPRLRSGTLMALVRRFNSIMASRALSEWPAVARWRWQRLERV